MTDETYEYYLHATGGRQDATLKIRENGEVECEYHWGGMGGQGFHYRLYGKHEPISDVFGWLRLHRVEDLGQSPAEIVHIEALDCELIYEYIKLPRSRFPLHPENALWVNGRWNEFFDLVLLTSNFVLECLDGLKYAITEGILEETEPPELREYINKTLIKHFETLFVDLDKTKFMKVDG